MEKQLMEFTEAYLTIVKSSIEQDKKEIPLLLSSANFKNKRCLEIGAGPLARLAVKLLKSKQAPKHITCLDIYNTEKIKEVAEKEGLENKISVVKPRDPLHFPFPDNSFDIVYAGWIPSELLKNPDYLRELNRISLRDIVFIMSGLKGDVPPIRDLILNENESQKRLELKKFLTDYFQRLNYKVDTSKQTTLRLNFADLDSIFGTFYFFDFKNQLNKVEQEKLREYLKPRIHDFKDNLYIFHAWRD